MRIAPTKRAAKISFMQKPGQVVFEGNTAQTLPAPSYGASENCLTKMLEATISTTGADTTLTGFVPAGSYVSSIVGYVTTTITTASRTGLTIGFSSGAAEIATLSYTSNALAKGSTFRSYNDGTAATCIGVKKAATDVVITQTGGSGNPTAGKVRFVMFYKTQTAPTS